MKNSQAYKKIFKKLKFERECINGTLSIKFLIFLPTFSFIESVEKSVNIFASSLRDKENYLVKYLNFYNKI